jgi:hypothetical protein
MPPGVLCLWCRSLRKPVCRARLVRLPGVYVAL